MTRDTQDQPFTLSRRSVLAGLGMTGVAAEGAAFGTTAYLNDTEQFAGNSVTAGEFDLQVDWQVTYDGPDGPVYVDASPDEFINDPEDPTRLLESADTSTAGVSLKRVMEFGIQSLHARRSLSEQDSVVFDLGAYPEQARDNTGGGSRPGLSVLNARANESANPGPYGLVFDLCNNLSESVVVTDLTILPADPAILALSDEVDHTAIPAGYEVYIDSATPGYTDILGVIALPGTITLGSDGYSDSADREPSLMPDETAQVTLFSFRDPNGDGVEMNGQRVVLTLAYRGETTGRTRSVTQSVVG